ncbi:hypothetical protein [Bathymodiolus japonicus methanotrophic gill symbiont]|uniref:hypothetical protein n=1 Tax=Bathymodiolus japonicus methanotrophic gill symbiont TaxID=113269 RepID=UPI001C8EFBC5|nr:hypothetical protein [Bathymodiolus japonicus methanotrophic gill symbiont]
MRSRCGRRAFRASPIRCVGERIMATGVTEFREVAWRACSLNTIERRDIIITRCSSFSIPLPSNSYLHPAEQYFNDAVGPRCQPRTG